MSVVRRSDPTFKFRRQTCFFSGLGALVVDPQAAKTKFVVADPLKESSTHRPLTGNKNQQLALSLQDITTDLKKTRFDRRAASKRGATI